MKHTHSTNKKTGKAVALALSALLLCAPAAMLTGCNEETTETTTPEPSQTDTQKVTNGNFEFYSTNSGKNLIVSSSISGWTKTLGQSADGSSAVSSVRTSGIIDTDTENWDSLTKSTYPLDSVEEAEAHWDEASLYDRLHFYSALKITDTDDFDGYVAYNISKDDIPDCANPGTHDNADGTSVLMVHNYRSDRYGTAQGFTTSTLTLKANTSAKISFWVKTSDLTYNGGKEINGNRGAYAAIKQTIGGTTLDPVLIKNIDTSAVTENNGWVQYTVYLRGHSLNDSTFSIELGLGRGGGNDKFEYVEGYAFFDDVTCEFIENSVYLEEASDLPGCDKTSSEEERTFPVDASAKGEYAFRSDLYATGELFSQRVVDFAPTKELSGDTYYTCIPAEGASVYKGLSFNTTNDLLWNTTVSELIASDNPYVSKIVSDDFADYPFAQEDVIFLMSASGASYTATVTAPSFTLAANEYCMVTYWVKTSWLNGYTGATMSLVDGETKTTVSSVDTTTISTVDVDNKKDLFDGWVKCAFLAANETSSEKTFSLEFSYGPTTIVGTTNASYRAGYAAFACFDFTTLTQDEYDSVSTGTYVKSATLLNNTKAESTDGFDNVIYSDADAIKTGFGTPISYTGVEGGSYYVGGSEYCYANSNENAGLLNRNYAANYWNENAEWFQTLLRVATAQDTSLTDALNADNWWNKVFGSANQPLLIVNTVEKAYGYIGSNLTISSSAYTTISVRVKVSKGAVATVYLMDTMSLTDGYNTPVTLKTPAVSYWYNDENDVTRIDPSSDEYNAKKDVVYYYNNSDDDQVQNGLYRSADPADTNVYANLSAYGKDDDGNLITESKEIAFFFNAEDGKYYAYYDDEKNVYSTEVTDFDHSYARYTEESAECVTVIDGNDPAVAGKWVTVNYYIHTGSEGKAYRLEVFSGSRDGSVKNPADSYVLFDANTT
ncbi:MAG: hypothetical protein ACI4U2_05965, partial [Christensenellaceae bacterium]